MGLEKLADKLDTYFSRLERGKAARIKPSHVEKVIAKLVARQASLTQDLQETEKPSKRERLEKKIASVHEQIERAQWLLDRIGNATGS